MLYKMNRLTAKINVKATSRILNRSVPPLLSRNKSSSCIAHGNSPTQIKPTSSQISRRTFTSTHPIRNQAKKPNTEDKSDDPGSYLLATFRNASRTTKIIVIVGLSIAGTAETIFWVKVLWRKFFSSDEVVTEKKV